MKPRNILAKMSRARALGGSAALVALVAALAIGTALSPVGQYGAATADTLPRATNMTTGMLPADFTEVIERVSPAVVNIQVTAKAEPGGAMPPDLPRGMEEFFRRFFGDQLPEGFRFRAPPGSVPQEAPRRAPQGVGSGFVIDPAGYIVTNNHVAGDAARITVTLHDGREYAGRLIGSDPETDLALIKIEAGHPLHHVRFSKEPTPRPGQWVIAVGNPFGLDHTATAGIVSATGRAIGSGPYDDFIQIDAPINKGNSGGPTFNLKGEVVGVNTAIFSPTGGSVGIGFAIPARIAEEVIAQLRDHGKVERGWLGVEIQAVTSDIAQSLGFDRPKGAIIARVMPDGPAATAGLRQGDVVLAVEGVDIGKVGDLSRHVAHMRPGSAAKLELLRDGKTMTLSVALGTRPSADRLAQARNVDSGASGAVLGMSLATVDDTVRQTYGLEDGVHGAVITRVAPGSVAAERGLDAGDVIVSVAGQRVRSAADVARQLDEAKKSDRKAVLMLVSKAGTERFVALPIG